MDDQQEDDDTVSEYRADVQMAETARELLLEAEPDEQGFEQDQPREGGEFLVFKTQIGNAVGLAMNLGFATLHVDGLFWLCCLLGANNVTKSRPFFM